MMRDQRLLVTTGVYVIALMLIGLWKTPVDRNLTVTELAPVLWMADLLNLTTPQSYTVVEAAANVALFIPLGALTLLWRRDWSWLHAATLAFGATALIETLQQVLRPERVAAMSDLVANTLGGVLGAIFVTSARLASRRTLRR